MPISYQQEFLISIRKELESLIVDHWEEIALNKEVIKLNPDWDAYETLEEDGTLKIFTARDDKTLIGYFVVFCRPHIHYKDHVFAYNDVVFLKAEYRKAGVGAELLRFAEKWLKEDKVSVLVVNTKRHKPFDNLLVDLGYTHTENIYTKLLR